MKGDISSIRLLPPKLLLALDELEGMSTCHELGWQVSRSCVLMGRRRRDMGCVSRYSNRSLSCDDHHIVLLLSEGVYVADERHVT